MKIRIVCYEEVDRWIIGKFALRMEENLLKLGHEVSIAKVVDDTADINHHLIYRDYNYQTSGIQTLMVTHIDTTKKLNQLKKQLKVSPMGICMSRETVDYLNNLGIPRERLSYVNPAHDGVIKPRKMRVGLTCRVQEDGRKRESFLGALTKYIQPEDFEFIIMGDGWDEQIDILKNAGFEVESHQEFNYQKYNEIIPSLDYYLYMGLDEGQMGFVDAVAAGVKTIVTTQGYHLDAPGGISYGFTSFDELAAIFQQIAAERRVLIDSVASWNWYDYTLKHVDIWNYLLAQQQQKDYAFQTKDYRDGICSVAEFDDQQVTKSSLKAVKDYLNLFIGKLKHSHYGSKNKRKTLKAKRQSA
ncbi:MAG: hypothetical protein ACKOW2_05370 [Sphingobacteriaceae bacterium]